MQVQDDARAGRARGGERAPAERGVDVVGVHDAGAGAAHGGARRRSGAQPAAQHRRRGRAAAAERGRVALEHLGVLAQVLADQPREVLDRALLAAGGAVAVVQEQDHRRASTGASRTPAFSATRVARSMASAPSPRRAATGAPAAEDASWRAARAGRPPAARAQADAVREAAPHEGRRAAFARPG